MGQKLQFIGVSLPTLFLLLWTVDAPLVLGRDVFLIAGLQLLALGAFFWRYYDPADEGNVA